MLRMQRLGFNNQRIGLAATVCLALQSAGCLPVRNQRQSSDVKLIGGSLVQEKAFPETFYIESHCTGTKIGPRHILTAAHCVTSDLFQDIRPEFMAENRHEIRLITARQFNSMTEDYHPDGSAGVIVTKVSVHPAYWAELTATKLEPKDEDNLEPLAMKPPFPPDLAVLEVKDVLSRKNHLSFESIPIAKIYSGNLAESADLYVLGYGCEMSNSAMPSGPVRLKAARMLPLNIVDIKSLERYRSMDLSKLGKSYLLTPGLSLQFPTIKKSTAEAASLCAGDSGGPVFVDAEAGKYALVAINSFASRDPATAKPGVSSVNGHTLLDRKWLEAVLGKSDH